MQRGLFVTDLPKCFSSYPMTPLCQEPLVKDFEIKSTMFLGSHLGALKIMLKVYFTTPPTACEDPCFFCTFTCIPVAYLVLQEG
ncbi:hypothetical protein E2320_012813 [Naja naja]|nr:hypothetical protein E2320_012813 [Naja naja]